MENTIDQAKIIKKCEEQILYILEEESGSLEEYLELLEMSREEIFMCFYHMVRDNTDRKEEFRIIIEDIIGTKPSSIIEKDYYKNIMESDSDMKSDIETEMESETIKNELIYILAAEEILYDN